MVMDNRRNITSREIQNAVLGETKRVLEIMEESKEKVSHLQQDLQHNECIIEQLENSIRIRKDTSNNNITIIESNETFKQNVKEVNRKFLSFAQLIYSSGQEFFKEQNIRESELDKLEGIIGKTEDTYKSREQQYETEEKQLLLQLQKFEEQNLEKDKIFKAKEQENRDLNCELNNLIKEIDFRQNENSEKEHVLNQEKSMYETEIEILNDKLVLADEELNCTLHSLEDINKTKANRQENISESLVNIDQMIQKGETELETKNKQMEDLMNVRNDISNKIIEMESSIVELEAEIVQTDINLRDVESKVITVEQNHIDEMDAHQGYITSHEKKLMDEKEMHLKLSEELNTCKIRIVKLREEVEDLNKYIDDLEARPKIDLTQQLEEKQIVMNEVKTMKQHCKEQLKTLTTEQQERIKKEQDEIAKVEKTIKNLEGDISSAEAAINNLKAEEELKTVENLELKQKLIELDSEFDHMQEAVSAKQEEVHSMQSKIFEIPSAKPKTVLPNKSRNWDSDSSIEGEDRSYSERARLKIRMMKKVAQ